MRINSWQKMGICKTTSKQLLIICLAFIIGIMVSKVAIALEDEPEYAENLGDAFLRRGVKSVSLRASFFSYKPQLEQFTELLNSLGSRGIDAALMSIVSITFKHTKELSSRLEIGYWTNDTELPLPTSADLSATFIPLSLNLIYYPVMLNEFIPCYFGGGIGYSNLSVSGSALDLLEQQGIAFDEENRGLTGYALIGVEYLFYDDKLSITIEAKQILKTFITSGTPSQKLEFDGTAIGMGIGLSF